MKSKSEFEFVFNQDGFGMLEELADTGMTPDDAVRVLLYPLAGSAITAIDWCIMTTGQHNCRTRHGRGFVGDGQGRDCDRRIGQVVMHYNSQPQDLLDIVIQYGHAAGLQVFGNIRLNHGALNTERLLSCPGRNAGYKKDFRDPAFHDYLCELVEDIDTKGVDAISLDFERKIPFFPDTAPLPERAEACIGFLRMVRSRTKKPIIVRVSHDREKGEPQGQVPERWMEEGLVNVVVPATHNHEPDSLDWSFDRFIAASQRSPRPCRIWPQIWPTAAHWKDDAANLHSRDAICRRVDDIQRAGAHGVYFFNFCCYGSQSNYFHMFKGLKTTKGT